MADHYATLGISPDSSPKLIRAAYLRLIRRYHPDRNPTPLAEIEVRKITAAHAVIGDPAERARYDARRTDAATRRATEFANPRHSRRAPRLITIAFSVAVVSLLMVVLLPPLTLPQVSGKIPSVGRGPDTVRQGAIEAGAAFDLVRVCSSPSASRLIKRELFRRTAQHRGQGPAEFERLAGRSLLKLDAAAFEKTNGNSDVINCKATVALELPQGVTIDNERRSLIGRIGYSVHRGDGTGRVSLRLGEGGELAKLLATLISTPMQADAVVRSAAALVQYPTSEPATAPSALLTRPDAIAPLAVRPQRTVAFKDPSFSCNSARSSAALSVCRSATLAGLDRQLASLWGDSMARANERTRAQLLRSDRRFFASRDSCTSDPCVHSAYTTQIREIQSLMASQQAPTN